MVSMYVIDGKMGASTCLDQGITSVKNRNTDVELVSDETEILFKAVQTSVCDSILVELVHEVHAEDNRHDMPIELSNEFRLLGCVGGVGTKVICLANDISLFWMFFEVVIVLDISFTDRAC